jgi:membrane protease YdiL (CAAX protease family)
MFELLFAFYLVIVMPAQALWRSLQPGPAKPALPPLRNYWRQCRHVGLLLAVLLAVEWQAGRNPGELGLDIPLSMPGLWGLCAAAAVLALIHVIGLVLEHRMTPQAKVEQARKMAANDSFPWPTTPAETAAFVASVTLMCVAWELLYRGFLLLVLAPRFGLAPAIVAAALAYGMAHGYKNRAQFFMSIVLAFLFTLGYAWTHSLWWLIVIHVVFPLASFWGVRKARRQVAQGAVAV